MFKLSRISRCLGLGLGATALLAGCTADPPRPETATAVAAVKAPATKTLTNFTSALRCMDDLLQSHGKKDITITTAGLPDSTGKVQVGTKEMLITAASRMSVKSKALRFIDYDTSSGDLITLFQDAASLGRDRSVPQYYIRGAVTQLDENAIDAQSGAGIALPFLDLGVSKDQVSSVVSMDMNLADSFTREILPNANSSNSLVITRVGSGKDLGGRIGKVGFSFNMNLNRAEGLGAGVRALVELGLIELVGKFTGTPYWKCLQIEKTNPVMIEQAREWYDGMSPQDRIKLVQRKLNGMGAYSGPVNGAISSALTNAIGKYQAENGLTADGRINFELYYALLDADQAMAADPAAPAAPAPAVVASAGGRGPMTLKLDSDKDGRYRVKDTLGARVQLSADGVLYCYYKDVSGTIARIFPNRFSPDPFLRANKSTAMPPESSPFKIRFDKAGREQINCYASDKDVVLPANLRAGDLAPLKVGSMDEISAAFRKSNPSVAEAKLDLVIQ